jgi:hypothetical protein
VKVEHEPQVPKVMRSVLTLLKSEVETIQSDEGRGLISRKIKVKADDLSLEVND